MDEQGDETKSSAVKNDKRNAPAKFLGTLRGKVTLGAMLSALVTAAGFASPEVRKATCLDLPTDTELTYPLAAGKLVSFDRLASSLAQPNFDGQRVVFRARYYGEALRSYYTAYLDPARTNGRAVINLRDEDHVARETPLGSDVSMLPPFPVLVDAATMQALESAAAGSLVEINGLAHYSTSPHSDSTIGTLYADARAHGADLPDTLVPDGMTLVVTAEAVQQLRPTNDPRDRWSCRLLHDLEPIGGSK